MNNARTAIFCDFDGTITRRDIGYSLFRHFSEGRIDPFVELWKNEELTTRECLTKEAAMIDATAEQIYSFLDQFELCRGFREFVNYCKACSADLTILSDGLDFYIEYVLKRYELSELPLLTNHGRFENNRLVVSFPYDNRDCDRCGSCKGERIREYRADHPEKVVVFVGDGYSDACGAAEADLVLAKKDLEHYCIKHNIEFTKYDDFHDVIHFLSDRGILTE